MVGEGDPCRVVVESLEVVEVWDTNFYDKRMLPAIPAIEIFQQTTAK